MLYPLLENSTRQDILLFFVRLPLADHLQITSLSWIHLTPVRLSLGFLNPPAQKTWILESLVKVSVVVIMFHCALKS